MKYIITSGAMEVKIDDVRNIVNLSTGKLACEFANMLLEKKQKVLFICTKSSRVPISNNNLEIIYIATPEELLNSLKQYIKEKDVIIHTMAVSDFKVNTVISINELYTFISENDFSSFADFSNKIKGININQNKLDSKRDQVLLLEKDIKVIDEIKNICSSCKLVSFKLLSGVDENTLIEVATKQLERTKSDIVVANKKEEISENKHVGYIISTNDIRKVLSKQEIAEEVIKKLGVL